VVCLDLNNNGDCDLGEPGIVGVTVYDPVVLECHSRTDKSGKMSGCEQSVAGLHGSRSALADQLMRQRHIYRNNYQ
jgi:hypothetical protein